MLKKGGGFIEIIIVVLKIIIIYIVIRSLFEIQKQYVLNNKINRDFLEIKINKNNFFKNIKINILQLKSVNKNIKFISPFSIIIFSFSSSIIMFFLSYKIFNITSSAFIISVFSFFIPYLILSFFLNKQKEKIIRDFPTYAITLKNYTKVTNDILIAFKRAKVQGPIEIYIKRFNISIEKGMNIYECFERLKEDINIKKINEFLTASQNCYINGGDFNKLLEKYSNIVTKTNIQKEKEKEESFSSKLVLYILIFINIYLLFCFGFGNIEYKELLTNTFFGKLIINVNIISYILIYIFIIKLNKMEE